MSSKLSYVTITKIGRVGLLHSVASGTAYGSTRSNRVSSATYNMQDGRHLAIEKFNQLL